MSVCTCDQAFSLKYLLHGSYMNAHQPSCAQHRHPTTLQAVDWLHGIPPWMTCINSFQLLKIYLASLLTFFFLRRHFLTCSACFLCTNQNDWLMYCFTCIHTTMYWYILPFRRKNPKYNPYFWQYVQNQNACTHQERWQITTVCYDLWQQQRFSY